MASSLITYYCFNDNDTTLVHDFSGNENHSTVETGLTISTDTGAIGKVGVFNGTTTEVNFGNITAFNSISAFSIVCKFKVDTLPAAVQQIARRENSFDLFISGATGNLGFYIYDNTATLQGFIHAAGIAAGVWYTIVATWDGENMKYYKDSSTSQYSYGASFATMNNPSTSFYIGSASASNYFDGSIEMISFYSKALTADEINAVVETPTGIRYEAGDGMIQTGDLIYNNNGSKEVCTWSEEFDEMEFKDNEQQLFADGELQIFKN